MWKMLNKILFKPKDGHTGGKHENSIPPQTLDNGGLNNEYQYRAVNQHSLLHLLPLHCSCGIHTFFRREETVMRLHGCTSWTKPSVFLFTLLHILSYATQTYDNDDDGDYDGDDDDDDDLVINVPFNSPASILHKSIAGRYRPLSYPGPL